MQVIGAIVTWADERLERALLAIAVKIPKFPVSSSDYLGPCMQVLLPAGVDAQPLPDWIFERSPAELKAAAAAARKRQDLEQARPTCPCGTPVLTHLLHPENSDR